MGISTLQFFDKATSQMVSTQSRINATQTQLASGKKINQASDAPEQVSSLQRLRTFIDQQEGYQKSLDQLSDRLNSQDTVLRNASELLIRLRELSIQYANGTLSPDQRRIAAIEVRGVREQLLSLANARDVNGQSMFAGARVAGPAFSQEGIYQGDNSRNEVPVSPSRLVSDQRVGSDIFTSVVRPNGLLPDTSVSFFGVIDSITQALEDNSVDGIRQGIEEVGQLQQGMSLALASVGSDMAVVESQRNLIDDQLITLRSLKSDVEDVDYNEAVTRMQRDLLSLQAAQSSFAQISRMTLFDYIR